MTSLLSPGGPGEAGSAPLLETHWCRIRSCSVGCQLSSPPAGNQRDRGGKGTFSTSSQESLDIFYSGHKHVRKTFRVQGSGGDGRISLLLSLPGSYRVCLSVQEVKP